MNDQVQRVRVMVQKGKKTNDILWSAGKLIPKILFQEFSKLPYFYFLVCTRDYALPLPWQSTCTELANLKPLDFR